MSEHLPDLNISALTKSTVFTPREILGEIEDAALDARPGMNPIDPTAYATAIYNAQPPFTDKELETAKALCVLAIEVFSPEEGHSYGDLQPEITLTPEQNAFATLLGALATMKQYRDKTD